MGRRIINILICLALASPAWACPKPAQGIKKGEPAPCDGILFSPEKEQELRIEFLKSKAKDEEIAIKDKQIKLYQSNEELLEEMLKKNEERSELWRTAAIENTKTLVKVERTRDTRDWMFFVGGILTTVAAGYAISQAAKE